MQKQMYEIKNKTMRTYQWTLDPWNIRHRSNLNEQKYHDTETGVGRAYDAWTYKQTYNQ